MDVGAEQAAVVHGRWRWKAGHRGTEKTVGLGRRRVMKKRSRHKHVLSHGSGVDEESHYCYALRMNPTELDRERRLRRGNTRSAPPLIVTSPSMRAAVHRCSNREEIRMRTSHAGNMGKTWNTCWCARSPWRKGGRFYVLKTWRAIIGTLSLLPFGPLGRGERAKLTRRQRYSAFLSNLERSGGRARMFCKRPPSPNV